MRLGLPRTHDSWLSKALSLGFNVPVDSVAEALVRIFPGASMKVGLLRGVLFGGILPGVGIYSPGAGDEVRCFQFIIREGFDAVPFLRFKPGGGTVKFLFSKDAVSKAFFRFETCCRCTGALQRNSVFGTPSWCFLPCPSAGRSRRRISLPGHPSALRPFFRIRALPGLKVCSYRAFCSTGAKCCYGDQKKVLYPEHAHVPLYSRMPRKLQTKRRLHCLMETPGVICLIPVGITWRRSAWRPDPSIPCQP